MLEKKRDVIQGAGSWLTKIRRTEIKRKL